MSPAETTGAFGIGILLAGLGAAELVRRKPGWWNRGWPVFYGAGWLLFGSILIAAALYQFTLFLPE